MTKGIIVYGDYNPHCGLQCYIAYGVCIYISTTNAVCDSDCDLEVSYIDALVCLYN